MFHLWNTIILLKRVGHPICSHLARRGLLHCHILAQIHMHMRQALHVMLDSIHWAASPMIPQDNLDSATQDKHWVRCQATSGGWNVNVKSCLTCLDAVILVAVGRNHYIAWKACFFAIYTNARVSRLCFFWPVDPAVGSSISQIGTTRSDIFRWHCAKRHIAFNTSWLLENPGKSLTWKLGVTDHILSRTHRQWLCRTVGMKISVMTCLRDPVPQRLGVVSVAAVGRQLSNVQRWKEC